MVQLSLEELKTVLKLLKDKKRKKRKNKGKKRKHVSSDGYAIGGAKSDSSHMQGYSKEMPFSNTSNQQTEIMALQKNLLEDHIRNPDRYITNRFEKPEIPNNVLTIEDALPAFNYLRNNMIELGKYTNTGLADLGYEMRDRFKPTQTNNKLFVEDVTGENINDIDETDLNVDEFDNIDVPTTNGSDNFASEGNPSPYAEVDSVQSSKISAQSKNPEDFKLEDTYKEPSPAKERKVINNLYKTAFRTPVSLRPNLNEATRRPNQTPRNRISNPIGFYSPSSESPVKRSQPSQPVFDDLDDYSALINSPILPIKEEEEGQEEGDKDQYYEALKKQPPPIAPKKKNVPGPFTPAKYTKQSVSPGGSKQFEYLNPEHYDRDYTPNLEREQNRKEAEENSKTDLAAAVKLNQELKAQSMKDRIAFFERSLPHQQPSIRNYLTEPIATKINTPTPVPGPIVKEKQLKDYLYNDTNWYNANVNKIIPLKETKGYSKENKNIREQNFKQLFKSLGQSDDNIDNYLSNSSYTEQRTLYQAVYDKINVRNNKLKKKNK
jgi:hypothetical protein